MRTERGNSCKESVVGWLVSQPVIGSVKACVHWDPPANRFTFIPEKPINFSICGNFIKLYRGLCWDNRRGTVCIVPPTLSCAVTDFWVRVWFGWEWNEISLINICQTSLWKVFQSNTLWMSEKRLHFCFPPTHEEWWPAASRMTTQCLFSTYRLALIRFTVRSELLHRPPFGGEQMISNSIVSGAPRFNNRHCSTWSSNFALGGWLGNCAKSRSTATYWPPWKQRFRICGPKRFN